jgi:hypothetical protein
MLANYQWPATGSASSAADGMVMAVSPSGVDDDFVVFEVVRRNWAQRA